MFGNYWIHIIVITTTNDYASPMLCYAMLCDNITEMGDGKVERKKKIVCKEPKKQKFRS